MLELAIGWRQSAILSMFVVLLPAAGQARSAGGAHAAAAPAAHRVLFDHHSAPASGRPAMLHHAGTPPSRSPGSAPAPAAPARSNTTSGTDASGGSGGVSAVPSALPPLTTPSATLPATMPDIPPLPAMTPPLVTQLATGGSTQSSLALSSGSDSEAAPSRPGGGGKSLQDCMGFWDAATHMSKREWRAACKRTLAEYPDIMR
jgi:hypothetical protein